MKGFTTGQRVVLLIGAGAALWALGWALLVDGDATGAGGWTNYVPNNQVVFSVSDGLRFSRAVTTAIVVLLVGAWTALGVLLFRRERG